MKSSIHLKWSGRKSSVPVNSSRAFTLMELLVVIGTLAVLALVKTVVKFGADVGLG